MQKVPPLINARYEANLTKQLDKSSKLRLMNSVTIDPPQPYGSAAWQTVKDIRNSEHILANSEIIDNQIPLGLLEIDNTEDENGDKKLFYMSYKGERHLITIAPNGSGKGTAVQIPVLLEYDASIFMIDPKGENAIITANYRKETLGQDVFILNPFGVLADEFKAQGLTFHGFNPLVALDITDDNFVADVSALSEALITTEGNDPYWSNAARELIACLIMYTCIEETELKNRNLKTMRRLLTQPEDNLLDLLRRIASNPNSFLPMRQKASLFTNSSKGTASIISTAITQTSFLDDPCLAENLCMDSFKFADFKNKHKKMTVFVVLPAKFILAYSKWFRLLVTSALDSLMSTHHKGEKSVLLMLDECAAIGYLSCIETAIGLARGYGIQIWSFFQDVHQLNDIYGKRAESFLANAGVQQFFTPNDMTVAEKISKRIGDMTAITFSANTNHEIANYMQRTSYSESETRKPLLEAVEVIGMHKNGQILFFEGEDKPLYAGKNYYYENPIYKKENRYRDNPYRPKPDENDG